MTNQAYLDLDSLSEERIPFILKLKGKEHALKPATVSDFAEIMKGIQDLPINASVSDEIALSVKIIKRQFPTMTDEDLGGLELAQLKLINDFGMQANSMTVEKQTEDAEGNAQAGN